MVKCKLIASARPAVNAQGKLGYSVFQQGAGLIDALGATSTSATGCANQGLNLAADLAGTQHFGGPANQRADGTYFLMAMKGLAPAQAVASDGYAWLPSATWAPAVYTWSQSYVWTYPYSWQRGYPWQGASAALAANTGNQLTPNSNGWAHVKSILPGTMPSPTTQAMSLFPAKQE